MFNLGDKVKIDFHKLKVDEDVLKNIKEWDESKNGIHEITNIFYKFKYRKHEKLRIELDGEFVFYENELILVEVL
jgi:hypothetical protein